MSIIEKAKQVSQYVNAYKNFLSELEQIRGQTEITVENLDPENYEDKRIKMQILLRGKSVDEYFGIVNGLMEKYRETDDKEERENLTKLIHIVMHIGEDNKGIDWS